MKGRARRGAADDERVGGLPVNDKGASGASDHAGARGGARRVVVITGFMAAGKTTVARRLARRLACRSIDLDELVAARRGRTPRQLIDEEGEAHFREAETEALRAALAPGGPEVVALGGGAWALRRNRALAEARGCLTVWLDAPFDLCWRRIKDAAPGDERPLGRDERAARQLYEERRASYRLARLRVRVRDDSTPEELSAAIAGALETDEITHD